MNDQLEGTFDQRWGRHQVIPNRQVWQGRHGQGLDSFLHDQETEGIAELPGLGRGEERCRVWPSRLDHRENQAGRAEALPVLRSAAEGLPPWGWPVRC